MNSHRNIVLGFLPHSWVMLVFSAGVILSMPLLGHAALYIGNGYLEMNLANSGTTYNNVDNANGSTLFTISQGQSLYLGGQIRTYPNQSGVTVTMYYSINGSSYQGLNLPYSNSGGFPNDPYDQWDSGASVSMAGLLNYNPSGQDNTVTVYFMAFNGADTAWYNNNGNNFTFHITATSVPEPIAFALPLFGCLLLTGSLTRYFFARRATRVH